MWRRSYLLLLVVRIYFALAPSYLHPDENFQGPEIIAGELFPYQVHKTWEWTSERPIRSVFPLWPVYGLPMTLLKWTWAEDEEGRVDPKAIYYALRLVMFVLSFVLEDWVIYELVHSPRHRRQVVILVASSYVTWSYQSHTFSNSIETLLVAWSLVLIERILNEKDRSSALSCGILSLLLVFGVFNRVTFPAFIIVPALRLIPHIYHRPISLISLIVSATFFMFLAIGIDTAFYYGPGSTISLAAFYDSIRKAPIVTPWNNIRYNTQSSNLALHGLHPYHQHFLVNLPQLLGPALILLVTSLQPFSIRSVRTALSNPRFLSAVSGTAILSVFPHQELRFLLPCLPLLLTCVRLPSSRRGKKWFWGSWISFNALLGILMGVYHQGGIIPAQLQIPSQISIDAEFENFQYQRNASHSQPTIFWWKTYPPPTYLLGTLKSSTVPLMGLPESEMASRLSSILPGSCDEPSSAPPHSHQPMVYLVAPLSFTNSFSPRKIAKTLPMTANRPADPLLSGQHTQYELTAHADDGTTVALELTLKWTYRQHVNLDDIDIAKDGIWGTLTRVVGQRGIGIWRVHRQGGCDGHDVTS